MKGPQGGRVYEGVRVRKGGIESFGMTNPL